MGVSSGVEIGGCEGSRRVSISVGAAACEMVGNDRSGVKVMR